MIQFISGLVRFIQGIWQSFFEKPVEQWLQRLLAGDFDFLFSQVIRVVLPLVAIFMLVDLLMNMKALRRRRDADAARAAHRQPRRGWLSRLMVVKEDESTEGDEPLQDENRPDSNLEGYEVVRTATPSELEQARRQDESMQDSRPIRRKSRTAEVMRNARRALAQDVELAEESHVKKDQVSRPSRPSGSMTGFTSPLPIQQVMQALQDGDDEAARQNDGPGREGGTPSA